MRPGIVATAAILSLYGGVAHADLEISAEGSWTPRVDDGDLAGAAGSDVASTYTSDPEDLTLSVSGATGASDAWRVEVRQELSPWWDSDLTLEIRRVGDGSGSGSVDGGTGFQTLGQSDAVFFTGEGDRASIQIQLRLSGVSVSDIPPEVYLSEITYTLVDT